MNISSQRISRTSSVNAQFMRKRQKSTMMSRMEDPSETNIQFLQLIKKNVMKNRRPPVQDWSMMSELQ